MHPTIYNELVKHRASLLNSLASAVVGTGFITPIAALLFQTIKTDLSGADVILIAINFFGTGVVLHMLGQLQLMLIEP